MKLPVDALIEALTHPSLYLTGDEHGGVGLHCSDHFDGGRPLAYYGEPDMYTDVPTVSAIPGLWAEAVQHLAQHTLSLVNTRADGPDPQPA